MKILNRCQNIIETITAFRPGYFNGELVSYKNGLYRWNSTAVNWLSVDEHKLHFTKPASNFNAYYSHGTNVGSATVGTRFEDPVYFTGHGFTRFTGTTVTSTVTLRANGTNIFTDTIPASTVSQHIVYPLNNPIYQVTNVSAKFSLFFGSTLSSSSVESTLYYRKIIL